MEDTGLASDGKAEGVAPTTNQGPAASNTLALGAGCWSSLQQSIEAFRRSEYAQAQVYAEEALALAQREESQTCAPWSTWHLGVICVYQGDYAGAARRFEQGRGLAEEISDPHLVDVIQVAGHLCSVLRAAQSLKECWEQALEKPNALLRECTSALMGTCSLAVANGYKRLSLYSSPDLVARTSRPDGGSEAELPPLITFKAPARIPLPLNAPVSSAATLQLLEIRCLGSFKVYRNGQAIELCHNRKAQTLLKYLAVHRRKPVPREALIELLWPDSDPKAGNYRLNTTVSTLRKSLSEQGQSEEATQYILFLDGCYGLNPELPIEVDIERFDAHWRAGLRWEQLGRSADATRDYEAAAAIYRGDLLLEDIYDDWTMIERERLLSTYLMILSKLAAYYLAEGQCEQAIAYGYELLKRDPCREDTHCLLMRCYSRLGQRSQALHEFELCEELLRRELGVAPSEETVRLYQAIARGEAV